MNKHIISIEQLKDILVDAPDLLVIVANPAKDELLVTYKGVSTFGAFGGDILERALTVEKFGTAHRDFATIVMQSTAKVMNAILDGIESINEALSDNSKQDGKEESSSTSGGSRGSITSTTSSTSGKKRVTKRSTK
jgi:hypothetical protein